MQKHLALLTALMLTLLNAHARATTFAPDTAGANPPSADAAADNAQNPAETPAERAKRMAKEAWEQHLKQQQAASDGQASGMKNRFTHTNTPEANAAPTPPAAAPAPVIRPAPPVALPHDSSASSGLRLSLLFFTIVIMIAWLSRRKSKPDAPQPQVDHHPAPTPAAPKAANAAQAQAAARQAVAKALPVIKQLGIDAPDGTPLRIRITDPRIDRPLTDNEQPVMQVVCGCAVSYLVDQGSHYAVISQGELALSGASLLDLHRNALNNLIAMTEKSDGVQVRRDGDCHIVQLDGNIDSALLLVGPLWENSLKPLAPKGLMAVAPCRNLLVFCETGSSRGAARMQEIAAMAIRKGDHPLSTAVLVRQADGRWLPQGNPA